MPDNPFSDPDIDNQIKARILRLQAASLEWGDNPTGGGFDDHIVETLVESLSIHADAYLCRVDCEDLVPQYVDYMRRVGAALTRNAEQRSFLSDPYSEDRLRQMAENSGEFIGQKYSLTPEQQEAEIRNLVERFRTKLREEAVKWHRWYNQIRSRIETRCEACYRRWQADAIEHVRVRKGGVTPAQPPGENGGKPKPEFEAASWAEVEISFFSEFSVQITVGETKAIREYGALGMAHKKDGKPTLAWKALHDLAIFNGVIGHSTGSVNTWGKMEKRMQELRAWLKERFGAPSDPLPFVKDTGYRAQFKINCAASYQR